MIKVEIVMGIERERMATRIRVAFMFHLGIVMLVWQFENGQHAYKSCKRESENERLP